METINNVASAASKAVFGDSTNKEPVSGAQGDTAKGEPYDAGNLDADSQEKLEKRLSEDDTRKPDASELHDSTRTEPVGPGPKPVDVVAREHGGDAGATDKPAQVNEEAKKDDAGDKKEETKPAAGTEVVHASGFAAEGGDFDASNPGAGAEADRLIEEKNKDPNAETKPAAAAATAGLSATTPAKKTDDNDTSKGKDSKDKPSLKDRIKAKLHRSK